MPPTTNGLAAGTVAVTGVVLDKEGCDSKMTRGTDFSRRPLVLNSASTFTGLEWKLPISKEKEVKERIRRSTRVETTRIKGSYCLFF
jgi:hypothetical protein